MKLLEVSTYTVKYPFESTNQQNEKFSNSVAYNSKSSEHDNANFKTYDSLSRKADVKPSLDPNHTHFLLVDNGKEQRFYDSEVTKIFYGDFLNLLSQKSKEEGGLDIPVITLLIEGGTTSIEGFLESLNRKIPCVIMEGSGRAADIIAYALKNKTSLNTKDTKQEIEKMIKASFQEGKTNVDRRKEIMNMISEIVEHEHSQMMTIIDLNQEEEDRDKKILFALLSRKDFSLTKQMWFSLRCNRADIANELISNENEGQFNQLSARDKNNFMSVILQMERVKFLELFLDNEFAVHEYLDVKMLKDLYNRLQRMVCESVRTTPSPRAGAASPPFVQPNRLTAGRQNKSKDFRQRIKIAGAIFVGANPYSN